MDSQRGTGRTRRQLENAPKGAIFIWVSSDTAYPKKLAQSIGRHDITIMGRNSLRYSFLIGRQIQGLVIDHAVEFSKEELATLKTIEHRINIKTAQ